MSSRIAFTFITLVSCSFTVLIALTLVFIMIIHLRHKHDVSLLLVTNTYAAMGVFALMVLSTSINVAKADFYGNLTLTDEELIGCQFQGFLIYETFGCFYMSFVLQAFYRLTKVTCTKHKFLQVCIF